MRKYLIGMLIGVVIAFTFQALSSEKEMNYIKIEYDPNGVGTRLDKMYITCKIDNYEKKEKLESSNFISWYGDKFFEGCEEMAKKFFDNLINKLGEKGIDIALSFTKGFLTGGFNHVSNMRYL